MPFSEAPECDHLTFTRARLVPPSVFVVHGSLTENLADQIDVWLMSLLWVHKQVKSPSCNFFVRPRDNTLQQKCGLCRAHCVLEANHDGSCLYVCWLGTFPTAFVPHKHMPACNFQSHNFSCYTGTALFKRDFTLEAFICIFSCSNTPASSLVLRDSAFYS